MEGYFTENVVTKVAHRGDLSQAAVDRVNLTNLHRLAVIISVAAAGDNLGAITLRQHTAQVGGSSKDLPLKNPSFVRLDKTSLSTEIAPQDPASAQITVTALNAVAGELTLEVLGEDLDRDNGFSFVSVEFGELTNGRVGAVRYESHIPRLKPAQELSV